ncbi:hypothetical protein AbraIFM66950_009608 [Aspergillus brasiliensis]|nr:hypothetical protein AbraIFM66950_009608 [Aspergillus brasiliensis]
MHTEEDSSTHLLEEGHDPIPSYKQTFRSAPPRASPLTTFIHLTKTCLIYSLALWGIFNLITLSTPHLDHLTTMTPHTGCDCGTSVAEAIARDCKFDGLAMAWLPPHCRDDELAAEFNTVGDGPNGTWIYYSDSERTIPMDVSEVAALADEPTALVHMSVQWHTLHCIFYWRKQYRARFNGKIVEPRSDSEHHIKHCGQIFLSPGSGTKSGVALVTNQE